MGASACSCGAKQSVASPTLSTELQKSPVPSAPESSGVPETLRYGPRELRHLKALGYNIDGLATSQDVAVKKSESGASSSRRLSPASEGPSPSTSSSEELPTRSGDVAAANGSSSSHAVPLTLRYGPRELRHLKALGYNIEGLAASQDCVKSNKLKPSLSDGSTSASSNPSTDGVVSTSARDGGRSPARDGSRSPVPSLTSSAS